MIGVRPLVTLCVCMTLGGGGEPFFGGGEVRGGNRARCVLKNSHASYFVHISIKPLSGHQLPDCFFWFFSVPPDKLRRNISVWYRTTSFRNFIDVVTSHRTVRNLTLVI
jgi:hypothetical protein